jgi:hypothetical protein
MLLEVGEGESESDREEVIQLRSFSAEEWTPQIDIQGFASILFELVVGHPAQGEASVPTGIPDFVYRIIESKFYLRSETRYSFDAILEILKQNDFRIEDGVDSAEVSKFVGWVESAKLPEK